MTHMRPKLVVTLFIFAVSILVALGCVPQSKYEAVMADLQKQADELSKTNQEKTQLQADLDAAQAAAEEAEQAKNDAETDIARLEDENTKLKNQAEQAKQAAAVDIAALKTANADLKKQVDQLSKVEQEKALLQKELDTAKAAVKKAEQAQADAKARIKTLEEENAALKKQAPQAEEPTP